LEALHTNRSAIGFIASRTFRSSWDGFGTRDAAEIAVSRRMRFTSSSSGNPSVPIERKAAMGIIAFIILGLVAGAIAKTIMPGDDPGGWIITAVIGVVGAILGGFLAGALFGADPMDEFFDISSWLTAIVGSLILLALYRVVVNRSGGHGALRT
jgi:uncharacterized membrane protein YeaQ/YmgE (transglycosylase-associated protein family)